MREDFFWTIIGLVWIFGWAAIWYLRRRDVDRREIERRKLLHRERLAAIEKGVPLPELPSDEESAAWLDPEAERLRVAWLRRISLALGLVALLAGVGICAAFYWAPDRGFHGMWTIGLIPALGGVGLLLYFLLSARPARPRIGPDIDLDTGPG